jgi:sterol 3beta-glucosyltransferase
MNITVMALGSRGDIQPFIALSVVLRERGHHVTLAVPNDFETQVNAYHIPYIPIPVSMKQILEKDAAKRFARNMLTPAALITFWREILPDIKRAYQVSVQVFAEAAQNADLLIAHGFVIPFAYSIHQHLNIPLLLSIAAPVVPTRMFPSPLFPPLPFGQQFYNPLTYNLLHRMVLGLMIEPMNVYRQDVGLPKLSLGQVMRLLSNRQFPVIMHYSRHLSPKPPDWHTNVHVVGAWTLPTQSNWIPPDALTTFLAEGEPPVFFGFGSMTVPNPEQMVQHISQALRLANLRGILQAGWAGLEHMDDEHLITIDDVPHDWLFPQMAAMVHHGGSGTTHAALAAGKPTLIVPFMADQPFWGRRLAELGVGVPTIAPKRLTPERLAAALRTLTQDRTMRQRATELGALLRAEDGLMLTCKLVEDYAAQHLQ